VLIKYKKLFSNHWFGDDKFGNLLYQESKRYDADGVFAGSFVSTNTYVPRSRSFDRPPGMQKALDRIWNRQATHR
jgi:hypothetical protein